MNYNEVLNWLFSQVPNYQKVGGSAYKPGLDKITNLLEKIGNPHHKLKTIHVAGTNGKGSTSHILASIFQENGYKVGLFTSPHIKDFRERIKINGELITEKTVVSFVEKYHAQFNALNASFFEITTALAFYAFEQNNCEISIIETGLGGRLDSTNVINPEIAVITNIGKDHTAFLGDTIEEIAFEKAGIIKQGKPVIIGETDPKSAPVFIQKAKLENTSIQFADQGELINYKTDLFGNFQQYNIRTALLAVSELRKVGWKLADEKIESALENVKGNTNFQGRLQLINTEPRIFVDAAHNLAGIKNLIAEVNSLNFDTLRIVYGASNDKDVKGIFKIFPKNAKYYFSEFKSARSTKIESYKKLGNDNGLNFKCFEHPLVALNSAKLEASENDLILVCGSFYLFEKII